MSLQDEIAKALSGTTTMAGMLLIGEHLLPAICSGVCVYLITHTLSFVAKAAHRKLMKR